MKVVIIAFAISFFISVCGFESGDQQDEFRRVTNEADQALIKKDYLTARKLYSEALKIAEDSERKLAMIEARSNMANISFADKDDTEAERYLIEAKDLCKQVGNCIGLETFYDRLMFHYLSTAPDLEKAEKMIDEMIDNETAVSRELPLKIRLFKYAGQMDTAGFKKDAQELKVRADQMP